MTTFTGSLTTGGFTCGQQAAAWMVWRKNSSENVKQLMRTEHVTADCANSPQNILKATIVILKTEDTGHLPSHLCLCHLKIQTYKETMETCASCILGMMRQQVWWWQTNLWWDTRSGSQKCDPAQLSSPGTDPQASEPAHGQETSARRLHFDLCCQFLQRLLPSKCKTGFRHFCFIVFVTSRMYEMR